MRFIDRDFSSLDFGMRPPPPHDHIPYHIQHKGPPDPEHFHYHFLSSSKPNEKSAGNSANTSGVSICGYNFKKIIDFVPRSSVNSNKV